jgi:hypothetical protein
MAVRDYRADSVASKVWSVTAPPIWRTEGAGITAQKSAGITSAIRLSTGRVVGVNRGDREVVLFAPSGKFERVVGAIGNCPGQFKRTFELVSGRGDDFAVLDGNGAVAIFDGSGSVKRSFNLPGETPNKARQPAGFLTDGSLIVYTGYSADPNWGVNKIRESMRVGHPIIARDSLLFVHHDSAGRAVSTIGPVLGRTRAFVGTTGDAASGQRAMIANMQPLPAMYDAIAATGKHVIYVFRELESEIAIYNLAGEQQVVIRAPILSANRGISGGKISGWSDARAGFRADDLGNLWYETDSTRTSRRWLVFAPDGSLIARAETPLGLRVLHIGETTVLGIRTTPDTDVLEVYRLNR